MNIRTTLKYVEGYFNDTLPILVKKNPYMKFSVIRLDGDTYFSTMDALKELYPRLSKGGFIIIDDFVDWKGCNDAILEYRKMHNITEPITLVPHLQKGKKGNSTEQVRGVFWRKGVTDDEMKYCPYHHHQSSNNFLTLRDSIYPQRLVPIHTVVENYDFPKNSLGVSIFDTTTAHSVCI